MKLLFVNLVPALCVIAAIALAYQNKEGWGWFLFVAVLCYGSVTITETKNIK